MVVRVFSDEEIRLMVGYEWAIIREKAAHANTYYFDMGEVPPVEISREKRVLGRCYYGRNPDGSRYIRKIRLTQFFAKEADLRATIRHEIAHALAYLTQSGRNHDHGWRTAAAFCGATPQACAANVTLTEPQVKNPYLTIGCPRCNVEAHVYRDGKTARFWLRPDAKGRCKNCGWLGGWNVTKHREPVKVARPVYFKRTESKPEHPPIPEVPEA